MGRIVFILFLEIIFLHPVRAEKDTILHFQHEKTIRGSYTSFYTDNFENIFLVSKTNQIKKLNQNLDSVGVFNDIRRYGDIYFIDVNNPLKIAVYYKDFTTLVILDRFLNIQNTIDLRNAGILQARTIAQSYDNNYWIFDELENTLKKIDDYGNVLLKTADFRVLFSDQYSPTRIIDEDGLLYLYDERKGWLIFDYYGAYKQHVDFSNWKDVNVYRNDLTGRDSMFFYAYNRKNLTDIKLQADIDLSGAIKIQRQVNKVFVLSKGQLSVYRIH